MPSLGRAWESCLISWGFFVKLQDQTRHVLPEGGFVKTSALTHQSCLGVPAPAAGQHQPSSPSSPLTRASAGGKRDDGCCEPSEGEHLGRKDPETPVCLFDMHWELSMKGLGMPADHQAGGRQAPCMLCQRRGGRPSVLAAPTEHGPSKAGCATSKASCRSLPQPCRPSVRPCTCRTPASISPESAAARGDWSRAGGVAVGGCSDFRWDALTSCSLLLPILTL